MYIDHIIQLDYMDYRGNSFLDYRQMYELSFCTFVIILQINYDERGDRYYARKTLCRNSKIYGQKCSH